MHENSWKQCVCARVLDSAARLWLHRFWEQGRKEGEIICLFHQWLYAMPSALHAISTWVYMLEHRCKTMLEGDGKSIMAEVEEKSHQSLTPGNIL